MVEHCRDFISYRGLLELPVKNVFFGNATVACQRIGHAQDVTGLALKDVNIYSEDSILTIDACIDGTYYWYGENKADALLGTTRMFGGVRCYSSRDFYNWKDEGLLLEPDSLNPLSPIHYSQKLERPHIIRNPRSGKYVLWAKSQAEDGYFAIFQADRFMGPYTFVRNLQPEGYGVGDFDMYVDELSDKGYV